MYKSKSNHEINLLNILLYFSFEYFNTNRASKEKKKWLIELFESIYARGVKYKV